MAEENISEVKEMIAEENCCFDAKPMVNCSVETLPLMDEESVEDVLPAAVSKLEINHGVSEPKAVNLRRYSTGGLDTRPGKAQVQPRYRGNQMGSTHDLCKHGKRREDDVMIKPWKLVKKKTVEGAEDLVKAESSDVRRKSVGKIPISKPEKSLQTAKKEVLVVEKSCVSVTSGPSSSKKSSEIMTSGDGSRIKNRDKAESTVRVTSKVTGSRNEKKTNLDVKKVLRTSDDKSSKDSLKNLKSKEKKKIEPVSSEDVVVPEKTLYVVESSIKGVQSEIRQRKKITRVVKKMETTPKLLPSLSPSKVKETRVTRSDPRPIRQTSRSKTSTSLSEKKVSDSANIITNSKPESKVRVKRSVLKVTPPARQLSFKRGKVLEPKTEDLTPKLIKFKKRVVQEPKIRSDVKKKSLKDKREGVGKINSGEGKREKVVLRHRKVEVKKKLQTLFNNVIEETANKLAEVRKSKVKALVGAFETVISLQDNKQSQKKKVQSSKSTASVVEV